MLARGPNPDACALEKKSSYHHAYGCPARPFLSTTLLSQASFGPSCAIGLDPCLCTRGPHRFPQRFFPWHFQSGGWFLPPVPAPILLCSPYLPVLERPSLLYGDQCDRLTKQPIYPVALRATPCTDGGINESTSSMDRLFLVLCWVLLGPHYSARLGLFILSDPNPWVGALFIRRGLFRETRFWPCGRKLCPVRPLDLFPIQLSCDP